MTSLSELGRLVCFFKFCFSVNIVAVWDEDFPLSCFGAALHS